MSVTPDGVDPQCQKCQGTGRVPTIAGSPLEFRPCDRCTQIHDKAYALCREIEDQARRLGTVTTVMYDAGLPVLCRFVAEEHHTRETMWYAREKWRNLARRYGCETPEDFMLYVAELHASVERLEDIVEYHRSFMNQDQLWQVDKGLAEVHDDSEGQE